MGHVPKRVESSFTKSEVKLRPFSDRNTQGLPYQEKRNLSNYDATLLAEAEAEEEVSIHLVRWSNAIRI